MNLKTCLLVFSRSPQAEGRIKGMIQAQELFHYAFRRILKAARKIDSADLWVATEDPGHWLAEGIATIDQGGGSFGRRLTHALETMRAKGYARAIVVPGDLPGLTRDHFQLALRLLDQHDLVLGPSPDGGIYLLGTSLDDIARFEKISWRTSRVFEELKALPSPLAADEANPPGCGMDGYGKAALPPLRDIDACADMLAMRKETGLSSELSVLLARLLRSFSNPIEFHRPRLLSFPFHLGPRGPPPLLAVA